MTRDEEQSARVGRRPAWWASVYLRWEKSVHRWLSTEACQARRGCEVRRAREGHTLSDGATCRAYVLVCGLGRLRKIGGHCEVDSGRRCARLSLSICGLVRAGLSVCACGSVRQPLSVCGDELGEACVDARSVVRAYA